MFFQANVENQLRINIFVQFSRDQNMLCKTARKNALVSAKMLEWLMQCLCAKNLIFSTNHEITVLLDGKLTLL